MGNWKDLKAAIANIIRSNGNQEITGTIMNNALNSIISNIGYYAAFAGIATPQTNPGHFDGLVFYVASEEGNYPNFNGITITTGQLCFFLNDGSSGEWSSMVLYIKAKVPDLIKTSESSNYLFNFLASKTENSINKETVFAIKKDGRLFAPPKGLAQNIDNEDDTLPISQGAVKRLFESMRKNG